MGSLLHPVGRESARVYWIRRSLVVGVVVALVAAVAWMLWPKPAPVSAVPAPAVTPTTGATADAASVEPTQTPTASATPTGPVACDPAFTRLSVAGFKEVKSGAKQVFTVSAANGGAQACILAIKPATFELTVSSGDDRIWSTADCKDWLPAKTMTLKPQAAHEFKVTWPLVRSTAGCKTSKDPVRPGTYVANAIYLETAKARQVMLVTK